MLLSADPWAASIGRGGALRRSAFLDLTEKGVDIGADLLGALLSVFDELIALTPGLATLIVRRNLLDECAYLTRKLLEMKCETAPDLLALFRRQKQPEGEAGRTAEQNAPRSCPYHFADRISFHGCLESMMLT